MWVLDAAKLCCLPPCPWLLFFTDHQSWFVSICCTTTEEVETLQHIEMPFKSPVKNSDVWKYWVYHNILLVFVYYLITNQDPVIVYPFDSIPEKERLGGNSNCLSLNSLTERQVEATIPLDKVLEGCVCFVMTGRLLYVGFCSQASLCHAAREREY